MAYEYLCEECGRSNPSNIYIVVGIYKPVNSPLPPMSMFSLVCLSCKERIQQEQARNGLPKLVWNGRNYVKSGEFVKSEVQNVDL